MGNRKSAPNMISIAAISSKRFQQSCNDQPKAPAIIEQESKWLLTERDVTFLCTQTGQYKYLFFVSLIQIDIWYEQAWRLAQICVKLDVRKQVTSHRALERIQRVL